MISLPETKYAKSGDLSIAYQVMGDGPLDLVIVPGFVAHVEFMHEFSGYTRFLEGLCSFARVITFDKRGTGLSDRVVGAPSLEERIDDVRAVMDAVDSECATIFGCSEGAAMGALFAATFPQRTMALILYAGFARLMWAPDYTTGIQPEPYAWLVDSLVNAWGQGNMSSSVTNPSLTPNADARSLWAKWERLYATPGTLRAAWEMNAKIDVRPILTAIQVPTLVLHRRGDPFCPLDWGRDLADRIPGARFVELDGDDHLFFAGDSAAPLAEMQEFLTGQRQAAIDLDRVLSTVLFTDIVASTERASELGDRNWRQLLDSHDEIVRRQLERFRGRLIKSTGDGVLATFDGPARGIGCARSICDGLRSLGLQIKAGLHTGEIELRGGDDIGGIAVHIAARVLEKAGPNEVLVSRTLTDLVAGSELRFEDRGEHALQGVAGKWHLFSVAA